MRNEGFIAAAASIDELWRFFVHVAAKNKLTNKLQQIAEATFSSSAAPEILLQMAAVTLGSCRESRSPRLADARIRRGRRQRYCPESGGCGYRIDSIAEAYGHTMDHGHANFFP